MLSHLVMFNICDPVDCSLPGSSVLGISQTRILEWVAISSSRGSSWPKDWAWVSCLTGRVFTIWVTREAKKGISESVCFWTLLLKQVLTTQTFWSFFPFNFYFWSSDLVKCKETLLLMITRKRSHKKVNNLSQIFNLQVSGNHRGSRGVCFGKVVVCTPKAQTLLYCKKHPTTAHQNLVDWESPVVQWLRIHLPKQGT